MTKQKFVIYRRLSKEDKTRNQHGFESQTDQINFYLKSLEGYEVLGDFSEFISGAADNRPELDKALQMCKEQGAMLLVAKLDRLSRRVSVIANYMEAGVEFRVATMPNADNFQLHIYSALAQQERESIRARVKAGLSAAKARGVKLGAASDKYKNNKAAGLHKQHVKVRNEQAAKARVEPLKDIITAAIQSCKVALKMSPTLQQIADMLTSMDVPLPSGIKGEWKRSQVSRVCKRLEVSIS